jgi:hypothetical protein
MSVMVLLSALNESSACKGNIREVPPLSFLLESCAASIVFATATGNKIV